ncbi:2TM domain-containing protein [Flavobacterium agrisoli]|uniref:2TM domain-containing protein n=1 Tax=Flavobacterium agrisoli TaxID=2793066 RepID=A0A934UKK5_9FLAO|nr:2TM domain-containing protein [Flavobacterium agrisoli]MBK0370653.1 2TM domain-containing protein [Flavobacterium agrisoli]
MENELHEQYEYARRRIKQKKGLYFHFVLFLLGSLFMFVANRFLNIGATVNWAIWAITFWFFILILHFIKVYITDRFMNKDWERAQIDRLVGLQQKRIAQLQETINQEEQDLPQ